MRNLFLNLLKSSWIFYTSILFLRHCNSIELQSHVSENRGRNFLQYIIPPKAKDWAQHFVNWNEGLICINDWYLLVFIHEKYLLSISSVLFIVHLHVINALKCHAGIIQKYGVTSCRVFFAITCWIRFCHEWEFSQSLKTPQTSINRGNITVSCVGVRELV